MKNLFIILFFVLLLSPLVSFSNGGPIDVSTFRKTGNIRLLKIADISLIKEDLSIKVIGDYTEIEVVYQLKNNGKQQKIHYGFPVDVYDVRWRGGSEKYTNSDMLMGKNNIVDYFNIYENDIKLKVSYWVVDSAYTAKTKNYLDYESFQILRKWFATTIEFKKGETKELKVCYKIKNNLSDGIRGFRYIYDFSDRYFTYHLTPASNWGNGIVNDFNLKIDLSALDSLGVVSNISGIDSLCKNNSIYTYHKTNYDLKASERINIHYKPQYVKLSKFINDSELPKSIIKSIKCSSNDSTITNLIDNSHKTTWTGKRGDWIEITLKKMPTRNHDGYIRPYGILFLNGDFSSSEQFIKSGKLVKFSLLINDTVFYQMRAWAYPHKKEIIRVQKSDFNFFNENVINGFSTILANGSTFLRTNIEYIHKIRIEIISVDGNAGETFSISELYFVGN